MRVAQSVSRTAVLALCILHRCAAAGAGSPPVDARLAPYRPGAVAFPAGANYLGPDGAVAIVGYNDMLNLLQAMDARFGASHPGFRFSLDLKGTRTAPPALTAGRSAFAPMGAEFSDADAEAFRRTTGLDPVAIRVAHASLSPRAKSGPVGIFVNSANPLGRATVDQVTRLFSDGGGRPGRAFSTWGEIGVPGAWEGKPIHPVGLDPSTALGIFMNRHHFGGRPFVAGYRGLAQSSEVIRRVKEDPLAVGFAALNLATEGVRALALAAEPGGPFVAGTAENVGGGRYPYDRYLLIYVRKPSSGLDPWIGEYLRLVLSAEGQRIVAETPEGYIPLNAREAAEELAKLR